MNLCENKYFVKKYLIKKLQNSQEFKKNGLDISICQSLYIPGCRNLRKHASSTHRNKSRINKFRESFTQTPSYPICLIQWFFLKIPQLGVLAMVGVITAEIFHICIHTFMPWTTFIFVYYIHVDIDECNTNTHNCHHHANCINIESSFNCDCKTGFAGNGTWCYGMWFLFFFMKKN